LNPLIYPDWWGNYESATDHEEELEDNSVF